MQKDTDFTAEDYFSLKARTIELLSEILLFRDCLFAEFFYKYDPNQPRAPRGTPIGGQWISGGGDAPTTQKPKEAIYKPENDKAFLLGVKLFGIPTKNDLNKHSDLIRRAAKFYKIDSNLIRGIIINESSTRYGAGTIEAIVSRVREEFGGYGTYGPAQLGPDARAALGLNAIDVLSYEGAIIGAAGFLNIERQKLILEGVKNPTNGQIAARYNWGNWPIDQEITKYGKRVEYLINRFYYAK